MNNILKLFLRRHFSFCKTERRKYKELLASALMERRKSQAKWGVSYSVFDGEELLEASVRHIRPHVDYIVVVWQRVSWYGNPARPDLLPLLESLLEKKLIDELIEYKPDLKLKAVKNETRKRNLGLKAARAAGITHYMTMDTDEFYLPDEIEASKDFILRNNITHSFCALLAYGEQPTELVMEQRCSCQYFSRISWHSKHCNEQDAIALVDPSRKVSLTPWWLGGSKSYYLHQIRMHHFSYIRKNYEQKLQNSSSRGSKTKTVGYLSQIDRSRFLRVPDYFNLVVLCESWQKK